MKSNENKVNKMFQPASLETLRRLFEATGEFQKLTPWKWMGDREVVAVHDPRTKQIGYCVVMGGITCCGLEVMIGDIGLMGYQKTIFGEFESGNFDDFHNKDGMALLFGDKGSLDEEDLALCEQVGKTNLARNAWPKFRRFEPGYFPWLLEENAAEFMAVCLEQVVEVARRAKTDPGVMGIRNGKTFLARIPELTAGKIVWKEKFISPKPLERVIRIVPKVNKAVLSQVFEAAERKGMGWEVDCFWGTVPIGQPGERLRYPFCYVVSDQASYYILHTNLVEENDYGADLLNQICEAVKKHGIYPEMIFIRHKHLGSVLEPLKDFHISIMVVDKLPTVESVRQEMFKAFKLGGVMNPADGEPAKQLKLTEIIKTPVMKDTFYDLRVTLDNVYPSIWRLIQVKSDITLKRLAATILIVMGWSNSHLHQFLIGGKRYSIPNEDLDDDIEDYSDEEQFRLYDFTPEDLRSFTFEYDPGDGWKHTIDFRKEMQQLKGIKYPFCYAGAGCCPPEDCGGPRGYQSFLDIISKPKHPKYKETIAWLGDSFDPDEFDVHSINKALTKVTQVEKAFDHAD